MTSAAGGLNSSTQKPLAGSPARMRAFSDRFTTRSLRSADPGAPAAAPLRSLAASPAPAIGPGARGGEAVMPPRNRSTAGLFLALTRPQAPPRSEKRRVGTSVYVRVELGGRRLIKNKIRIIKKT